MDDEFELDRAEDGGCYFLEDGLCGIHAEQGLAAKPSVCQLYPFSLVATPEGYYVSLAFTCPAVISGSGNPIEEQRESLRATVEGAPHFFPPGLQPGSQVTLTAETTICFDQYRQLEDTLLKSFGDGRNLVGVLLGAAASVMDGSWSSRPTERTSLVWTNLHQMLPLFLANSVASMERKSRPEERAEYAQCLLYGGVVESEILHLPAHPECTETIRQVQDLGKGPSHRSHSGSPSSPPGPLPGTARLLLSSPKKPAWLSSFRPRHPGVVVRSC